MVRETPGVVVELHVARTNVIVQHRKPWNAGAVSALGWNRMGDSRDYFGGGTCDSYPRGKQVLLAPRGEGSGKWPPDDLPNFLGLQTLEAVPARYLPLIRGT
jgi:hypothetical protein